MGIYRWGLRGDASRSYLYKHVSITKGDMACDVMSRLSDPHLRKLATYSHAFLIASCEVFLQCAQITAFIITNCFGYSCLFLSLTLFRVSFPDVASFVDFLYCLVCLREILLHKKMKTWKKFRVVTAPVLKFRMVSRPPCPHLAARLLYSAVSAWLPQWSPGIAFHTIPVMVGCFHQSWWSMKLDHE